MARAPGRQPGVGIGSPGRRCPRDQITPRAPGVFGDLNPVAVERRAPGVVRDGPPQVDAGRTARHGREPGGCAGKVRVRGGKGDIGPRACAGPIDRGDAVVARGIGRQSRVRVGCRIRTPPLHQQAPGPLPVFRDLDSVAGDRRPAVVGRRIPFKVDPRRTNGIGHQIPGRTRHVGSRGRPGGQRGPSRTLPVVRRDPIVTRGRRLQVADRVPRGCRGRGDQQLPARNAIVRDFDSVTRDGGTPIVRGGIPREGDARGRLPGGPQTGRCCRHGGGSGRAYCAGKLTPAPGIDRGHPIVAGRARPETRMGIPGSRAGVRHQDAPARPAIGRGFYNIPGDALAAVRSRLRPEKVDPAGA